MTVFTGIAIYFTIWWTVLFSILPLGVTSHAEAGIDPGDGGVVDVRQHRFALRGRRVLVGLGDELGDVERHDHRQGAPWRQNYRVGVVAHGAADELAEGVGLP